MQKELEAKGFWTVTDYLEYALLVVSYFTSQVKVREVEETAGGRLDGWRLQVEAKEIDREEIHGIVSRAGGLFLRTSQMEIFYLEDKYEIEFTIS